MFKDSRPPNSSGIRIGCAPPPVSGTGCNSLATGLLRGVFNWQMRGIDLGELSGVSPLDRGMVHVSALVVGGTTDGTGAGATLATRSGSETSGAGLIRG